MSYRAEALRPGDVLLMTTGPKQSLGSRLLDVLIAVSEGNPFVHSCLVGDGHLIDPTWPSVQQAPLDRYSRSGWAFRVHTGEMRRQAALAWAEAHVGNPYGIGELFADAARYDLHIVLPAWYRWRPGRWTCSGFVSQAYLAAGVTLTRAPLPSPADLSYSPDLIGPRPWHARRRGPPRRPTTRDA